MRRSIAAIVLLPVCMLVVNLQAARAFDLPEAALRLIAETTADPCPICVRQKLKEAFALMAAGLQPGLDIDTDETCRLMKTGREDGQEFTLTCYPAEALKQTIRGGQMLPEVAFVFYTPEKRLVGISEEDYTDGTVAEGFRDLPPGTVFEGRIRLIPYRYGDGPAFNYYRASNRVQIHCTILRLNPLKRTGPVKDF